MITAEEEEPYKELVAGHEAELLPVGVQEKFLVPAIANNRWRVTQIDSMESAIYGLGRIRHADKVEDESPEMAAAYCRLLTLREDQKELDRLHRYESRLLRQIRNDMQELFELQTERKKLTAEQQKEAVALNNHFTNAGKTWHPADFGFVLSIEEIIRLEERELHRDLARAAQLSREK